MQILFLIALVLLAVSGSWSQSPLAGSHDHDFGIVIQGERLSHTFDIRNATDTSLRIEKIEMSVPGATARFKPEILPGTSSSIVLDWNTAGLSGAVDGTALLYTNNLLEPQIALGFKAMIQPPIEFDPFPAVFFSAYQDETPERHVRILNHENTRLEFSKIEAPQNRYEVQVTTVRPGREFDLAIKVRPGTPFGRYREPIYITTNSKTRPRLQVQANLFVKADVYAFPEDIDFGTIALSELQQNPKLLHLLTQTTVVASRSSSVQVLSIECSLPFLRLAHNANDGPTQKIAITADLVREKLQRGSFRGIITVRINDLHNPILEIPLRGEIR